MKASNTPSELPINVQLLIENIKANPQKVLKELKNNDNMNIIKYLWEHHQEFVLSLIPNESKRHSPKPKEILLSPQMMSSLPLEKRDRAVLATCLIPLSSFSKNKTYQVVRRGSDGRFHNATSCYSVDKIETFEL